jgi:hypothetical protein
VTSSVNIWQKWDVASKLNRMLCLAAWLSDLLFKRANSITALLAM